MTAAFIISRATMMTRFSVSFLPRNDSIRHACWLAVCVFTSALFSMFLRAILPQHHLSQDTKQGVNLTMSLIARMAGIALQGSKITRITPDK